jgi:hypothetical protein
MFTSLEPHQVSWGRGGIRPWMHSTILDLHSLADTVDYGIVTLARSRLSTCRGLKFP